MKLLLITMESDAKKWANILDFDWNSCHQVIIHYFPHSTCGTNDCELSEHMQCASNVLDGLHTDYTQISSTSIVPFPGKISGSKRPSIYIVPKEKNQQGL
jgi:hypothetical protein